MGEETWTIPIMTGPVYGKKKPIKGGTGVDRHVKKTYHPPSCGEPNEKSLVISSKPKEKKKRI